MMVVLTDNFYQNENIFIPSLMIVYIEEYQTIQSYFCVFKDHVMEKKKSGFITLPGKV